MITNKFLECPCQYKVKHHLVKEVWLFSMTRYKTFMCFLFEAMEVSHTMKSQSSIINHQRHFTVREHKSKGKHFPPWVIWKQQRHGERRQMLVKDWCVFSTSPTNKWNVEHGYLLPYNLFSPPWIIQIKKNSATSSQPHIVKIPKDNTT